MDPQSIFQATASTYDSLAERYERVVTPIYRPLAKRLLQYKDLRPGWTVLDAGTGTGLVALLGAVRVGKMGRMIGVDVSEKMLESARKKAAQFGFSQCDFRLGDIQALEFPDAVFNVVLSEFALHYTDVEKALLELHRVLQPNGALVLQAWAAESSEPHKVMWDVLATYRVSEVSTSLAASRAQADRSLQFRRKYGSPDALANAIELAGFTRVVAHPESYPTKVSSVEDFLEVAFAAPSLNSEITALTVEARQDYIHDVRVALKKFETVDGFEWTYYTIVIVAAH